MKDICDTGLFLSTEYFLAGLAKAIFMLVEKLPDNNKLLMIWVSGRGMSSNHSSRSGSNSQYVGLGFFTIACSCEIVTENFPNVMYK